MSGYPARPLHNHLPEVLRRFSDELAGPFGLTIAFLRRPFKRLQFLWRRTVLAERVIAGFHLDFAQRDNVRA